MSKLDRVNAIAEELAKVVAKLDPKSKQHHDVEASYEILTSTGSERIDALRNAFIDVLIAQEE
jgi:hypothetical protein